MDNFKGDFLNILNPDFKIVVSWPNCPRKWPNFQWKAYLFNYEIVTLVFFKGLLFDLKLYLMSLCILVCVVCVCVCDPLKEHVVANSALYVVTVNDKHIIFIQFYATESDITVVVVVFD